jgi:uncharacterized protein
MDITPLIPAGRQLVEGYGDGGFTISGVRWSGSVLVLPMRTLAWPVAVWDDLSLASLAGLLGEPAPDILLLGCGPKAGIVSRDIRAALKSLGTVVEAMDTGAACRTYNVLLTEDRRVAAALIAV